MASALSTGCVSTTNERRQEFLEAAVAVRLRKAHDAAARRRLLALTLREVRIYRESIDAEPNRGECVTDRQRQVYDAIGRYIAEKRYPPTIRDICRMVGLRSAATVHHHLRQLSRQGLIAWDPTCPRTIQIIKTTPNVAGDAGGKQ